MIIKICFLTGQHSFRKNHSCETALHELISDLNLSKDKKLISLLLFIDFRAAFDCVDTDLLLTKLFHYGFSTSALRLVADYFHNRTQITKIGKESSKSLSITLGLGQGSSLSPCLFLIFINDLPFFVNQLKCKLFADDSTLYYESDNLDSLITDFTYRTKSLVDWCTNNRIDINWKKTFCMFVTNKRILLPTSLELFGEKISVVENFKLLGVTLDNKLNFKQHCANICSTINSKLFTIKKIFQLCTSVKIQFFKTFLMPYFDYCNSLLIYFSREALQKLFNKFYFCAFKLFKVDFSSFDSISDVNNFLLKNYNIYCFQSRTLVRFSTLTFKMIHYSSPVQLKEESLNNLLTLSLIDSAPPDDTRTLRNNKTYCTSQSDTPKLSFESLSSKTLSLIGVDNFCTSISSFKNLLKNKINSFTEQFLLFFPKFNLLYKNFNWTKF